MAAALTALIFMFDILIPLGVAGGVPYVAVVLLGTWFPKRWHVAPLAIITSGMVVLGYYISPAGGIEWMVLFNRALALFAIWVCALLMFMWKNTQSDLQTAKDNLEVQVDARTRELRLVTDTLPVLIIHYTPDEKILFANKTARQWLELGNDDVTGKTVAQCTTAEAYENLKPRLDKAMAGKAQFFETRLLYRDGVECDIEGSMVPDIDADGVVRGGISLSMDVSERKDSDRALAASELKYRSIFEAAHVGIIRTQLTDGKVIDVNDRNATMLGYKDGEDLMENYDPDAHWTSREERNLWITEGLADDFKGHRELSLVRKDGSTVWLRTSATFHPSINCVDVVSIDITEAKLQQAATIAAREEAQSANRAKSEFLAHFSHELRTPLNAVIGFSELMQQEVFGPMGDPQYREYADDIHKSGEHLLALINDILDLARIESGKQERDEQVFDASEIAEDCARLLHGRAAAKGVEIELQLADEPPQIKADERQLRQILLNLLTNAVKFTRKDTVITVETEVCTRGDYHFRVSDHGEGMSAEDIVRVQEPFIRLDDAHTSSEEGTGLGLAITKSLIESHGGCLRLASEVGVGTTATVSFPRERVIDQVG